MGLNIQTSTINATFNGPFASTGYLADDSGVYVITTQLNDGTHFILDVGESHKVRTRVENHDRLHQWEEKVINGIFYSTFYCPESSRMQLEGHLRDFFNPPCGIR